MSSTTSGSAPPSATDDLTPFVPQLAIALGSRPGNLWSAVDGSMLSADISGFTALSERLAGKGKAGAEQVTGLINSCFTALIDAAYDFGGEVLKFGGDALLVMFRGESHRRRVADAAFAMQRALHTSGAARRARLTMTIGAAEGPFDIFLVGRQPRELIVTGPAATEVIRLEAAADAAESLVSPTIAAALPPEALGRRAEGGVAVTAPTGDGPTGPGLRAAPGRSLAAFVPEVVARELAAFSDLGGEHRLVAIGFVAVTGIAEKLASIGPQRVADHLGRFVDALHTAVAPYAVTPLHTDIAPDGVKFVLCAGAPTTSGDTSDAMLEAALGVAAIETPFVVKQGVQRGRVFAGFLGSPYRQTYTLMGDPVNTAARMLGPCDDGQVVAVDDVVRDTRTTFRTIPLEPFTVKGKADPIVAHVVEAVTDEVQGRGRRTELFGRGEELAAIRRALAVDGTTLELVGPAGVGKSALLEAVLDDPRGATSVFRASCTPYGTASPYSMFRPLLRSGSGIPLDAEGPAAGRALTQLVSIFAPELAPYLPLLAAPIGAEVAPTPEVDALGEQFRRARLHDTVVEFLDATLDERVLLVAEDVHWIDDASAELLAHLVEAGRSRPWAAIITTRTRGGWASARGDVSTEIIPVEVLGADRIRDLAVASADRALSEHELATVVDRAEGNPLFALELTRAVAEGGQEALPDSVEALLANRIDDLVPDDRFLVRLAAVCGSRFRIEDVETIARRERGRIDASRLTLLDDLVTPALEGVYGWRHALYRDAAYEGLPFKQRQRLHAEVGHHIESRTGVDVSDDAALLSLHFSKGRVHDRAWAYSIMSGDHAAAIFSPVEATEAYGRALEAGRYAKGVTRRQRSHAAAKLGDAAEVAGLYDLARSSYRQSRRLLGPDDADQLPLFRKQGVVAEREGNYRRAMRWYRSGLDAMATLDHDHPGEDAELRVAMAGVHFRQGEYQRCFELAIAVAGDLLNQPKARFRGHYLANLAGTYLGRSESVRHGELAQELEDLVEDPVLRGNLYNNLGIAAYYAGDWNRAAADYERSYELRRASGDVSGAIETLNNIGELRSDQGRLDEARRHFETARREAEAAGYEMAVHVITSNLARLAGRAGDRGTALALLDEAQAAFERIESHAYVLDTRFRRLELAEPEEVLALGPALLAAVDRAGIGATIEVPLQRVLGSAARRTGQLELAVDWLRGSQSAAAAEGISYELARTLVELAELADERPDLLADDPVDPAHARREAERIFGQMGVTSPDQA